MPGSWPPNELPHLTFDTCEITSPMSRRYNCIAWAAGANDRWWWPDPEGLYFWPDGVPREETVDAFMQAYATCGYQLCLNSSLRAALEKIALFGIKTSDGSTLPTHAALQLESGEWTSKLGTLEDVRHKTDDAVNGPLYGKVVCYMSRPRNALRSIDWTQKGYG